MKFSQFIVRDSVIPQLESRDRDGVLRELVASLAKCEAIPEAIVDEIVAEMIKREKIASTGLGKGVGIPHLRHAKIKKMVGTVGRCEGGMEFASVDRQPVYSFFLLLSPEKDIQAHQQAMALIWSNLNDDRFRKFLRQSATQQAIVELLDESDQAQPSK